MDRISIIRELIIDHSDEEEENDFHSVSMSSRSSISENNPIFVYKDENPYQTVGIDDDTNIHQIIGNELIFITAGDGYCCLCREVKRILYTDNSFGNNIPVQICMPCIHSIVMKTDLEAEGKDGS